MKIKAKKHGIKNILFVTLANWGFRRLGLHQTRSMEAFYVFILLFFYILKLVTIHVRCLEDTATLFFCETPALFCGLKKTKQDLQSA